MSRADSIITVDDFINLFPTSNRRTNIHVDMVDEENYIYLYAEIPGVNKEDVVVDFYNNKVSISVDKNRNYVQPERPEIKYGHFERSITLPICITKKETVSVNIKNGILKIKINKHIEEENKFTVRLDNEEV